MRGWQEERACLGKSYVELISSDLRPMLYDYFVHIFLVVVNEYARTRTSESINELNWIAITFCIADIIENMRAASAHERNAIEIFRKCRINFELWIL